MRKKMQKKRLARRVVSRSLASRVEPNLTGMKIVKKCELRIELLVDSLDRFNDFFEDLEVGVKPDSNEIYSALNEIEGFMAKYAEDEFELGRILLDESEGFSEVVDGEFPEWDVGSYLDGDESEENRKLVESIDKKMDRLVSMVRKDCYEVYHVMIGAV